MSQEETTRTNLANQRKVASLFLVDYPHPELTAMRFTREGERPGLGVPWSVNVVVTVAGTDYNEILATNDVWGGDRLPELHPGSTHGPVTVTYSDGTAEVFQ
ncbi:hypothetical protein HNO83_01925 [Leifsonia sp. C5G2]|nr:hypothetical protein [Leifsonia sp. C5G2]